MDKTEQTLVVDGVDARDVPLLKKKTAEALNSFAARDKVLRWAMAPSNYATKIGNDGPVPAETGMTNLDVLAELVARNGFKPEVTGWGFFSGPFGLTQADGFALMQLSNYYQGLMDGAGADANFMNETYLAPKLMSLQSAMNLDVPDEEPAPMSDPLARDADETDGA